MKFGSRLHVLVLAALLLFIPLLAYADDTEDLAQLDIEELMDVEVVTASRRTEPFSQVAGAITVLDEDDIFRSGATSLPEALKLVPGVHVAQVDTDQWAVGIRGFNGLLSNKHLVLVDGRPITSSTMGGVFWGSTIPINLVKRIEVVRGAWTHLWGADSFTGVINVITKTADETQGGQSMTMLGTTGFEQTFRIGDTMGDNGHYRAYVNGAYRSGSWLTSDSETSSKDWLKHQAGFRADWVNAYTDALSFQGDLVGSSIEDNAGGTDHIYTPHKREDYGGFAQVVWDRATGLDAGLKFRTSYTRDFQRFDDLSGGTNTLDAEFQNSMEQMGNHRIIWGVGSRYFWDDLRSGQSATISPSNDSNLTSNAFIQDKYTLIDESLYLIVGSKFDYFGEDKSQHPIEIQPTIRLLHTRKNDEFWMAVSRAVRSDNRSQRDGTYIIDHNGDKYTVVVPNDLATETLMAYEAGVRHTFSKEAHTDLSLYVNDYDNLIMLRFDPVAKTAMLDNTLKGTAYGLEWLFDWQAADWLRLQPSTSIIYQNIYGDSGAPAGSSMPEEGLGTETKLQVLTKPYKDVGLDVSLGYLDSPDQMRLPGFFSLDVHGSWKATDSLMLEIIARNLDGGERQFSQFEVGPRLDLRLTWDF